LNNSFVELIQLHPKHQQSSCPHYPSIRFSGRIIEKIVKSGRSSHTTPVANPILTKSGYISLWDCHALVLGSVGFVADHGRLPWVGSYPYALAGTTKRTSICVSK
jgi:hypothetical protein